MMRPDDLSSDELKELVRIYARNIYALHGTWFQSVEQAEGMDEAGSKFSEPARINRVEWIGKGFVAAFFSFSKFGSSAC